MDISDAPREVRYVYRGGSVGQFVSGLLWLASAAFASYGIPRAAIVMLVVGGVSIFPVMTLVVRLMGARYLPSSFCTACRCSVCWAGMLIGLGLVLAQAPSVSFAAPPWLTGIVLLVFGAIGLYQTRQERAESITS